MNAILLVFFGAGIGGVARHLVNITAPRLVGYGFPFGTMCINVLGSFLIGCVAGWLVFRADASWSQHARLFTVTGILGGFTTFSAFSLDFATLWERGATLPAFGYALASVIGAIIALFLGLWLARSLP